jgi:hypothetical protein
MRILAVAWFVVLMLSFQPTSDRMFLSSQVTEEASIVKLRGEVAELRLLEENKNTIRWELKLKLHLVNEGKESAILLRQDLKIGAVMLARSLENANEGHYIYRQSAWPSVYAGPEWERWRNNVDSASPQPAQTWILTPGQSLSFDARTTVYVERAGNFDRTNAPWEEIKKNVSYLQVQIKSWPSNIEPRHDPEDPEFGRTLRRRWKSFGDLQLALLTSEPMQLSFPQ